MSLSDLTLKQKLLASAALVPVAAYLAGKLGQGVLVGYLASVAIGYGMTRYFLQDEIKLIERYAPAANALADAADALRRVGT